MKSDPKLKECLAKIEALCREYECGGYVSLVSKTHGEFRPILADWAGLSEITDDTGRVVGVRLTCKKEEKEKAELTAHFIYSGREVSGHAFQYFDHLCNMTKTAWKTVREPFAGYTPHRKDVN